MGARYVRDERIATYERIAIHDGMAAAYIDVHVFHFLAAKLIVTRLSVLRAIIGTKDCARGQPGNNVLPNPFFFTALRVFDLYRT